MIDETLSMLASSAEAFAKPDAKRVRSLRNGEAGFDRNVWRSIAGQGWLSILVPEKMDGLGLGMAAAAVIARRLGYALFPEPYVASGIMATRCLVSGDNEALQRRVLPELMAGERIAALAWQDESGSLTAAGVTATSAGEGVTLNGSSRFVPVASADAYIVAARDARRRDDRGSAEGLALYWVVRDAPGLACVP
jgi:3-oxochol-4-en-24-oyl-CoA dehydrogenase